MGHTLFATVLVGRTVFIGAGDLVTDGPNEV